MMKAVQSPVDVGKCLPLNKAAVLHRASDASVAAGKAVTVLTYLHGVKEAEMAVEAIQAEVGREGPRTAIRPGRRSSAHMRSPPTADPCAPCPPRSPLAACSARLRASLTAGL